MSENTDVDTQFVGMAKEASETFVPYLVAQQDQIDRIEEKVDTILNIMGAVNAHIEAFKGAIEGLENTPIGTMLGLKNLRG